MSALQIFEVGAQPWRFGTDEAGRPYVVAADIARALDYRDAANALRLLDDDEKGTQIVSTPGGKQRVSVVFEDGIWELIFLSRKPQAKAIKKRVKEILREIRETGRYETTPTPAVDISRLDRRALAQMVIDAEDAREAAERRAAELEPRAHSWDVLASGDGDFSVADAAKILDRDPGISTGQGRLFTALADLGWVYRAGDGRPRAYQRAVDRGWLSELPQTYTHPRTGETALGAPQVRVTPKGLAELHRRLGGRAPLQLPQETLL